MTAAFSGTTGASLVQDGTITAAKLAPNAVDTQTKAVLNASGSAPIYACRAWAAGVAVTTASPTIYANGNVTSITRTAIGVWSVVFGIALPNAFYSVVTNSGQQGVISRGQAKTTAGFEFRIENTNTQSLIDPAVGTNFDFQIVSI